MNTPCVSNIPVLIKLAVTMTQEDELLFSNLELNGKTLFFVRVSSNTRNNLSSSKFIYHQLLRITVSTK